jgi:hypothetical protein
MGLGHSCFAVSEPPHCHVCGRYISPWCDYPDCPYRQSVEAERREALEPPITDPKGSMEGQDGIGWLVFWLV